MKKILLFSIFLTWLTFPSCAQSKVGIIGGINFAKIHENAAGDNSGMLTLNSFRVGIMADIRLSKYVCFQPQLLLSGKGLKGKGDGITTIINPYYFEIPFNFLYKKSVGNSKFFAGSGPYAGIGLFGKTKSGDSNEKIKFGSGSENDLKTFDYGFNFTVGYELNSGFQINANYSLGLSNIIPGSPSGSFLRDLKAYNRYFGISIGYLFGGKKK